MDFWGIFADILADIFPQCQPHTLHNNTLVGKRKLTDAGCQVLLTSPVFEISGVTLQFVNISRQNPFEGMSSNEEFDGLLE